MWMRVFACRCAPLFVGYPGVCRASLVLPLCPCAARFEEWRALVDFHASTDGPHWVNRTSWGVGSNPCMWFGVTCSTSGRVEYVHPLFGFLFLVLAPLGRLVTWLPLALACQGGHDCCLCVTVRVRVQAARAAQQWTVWDLPGELFRASNAYHVRRTHLLFRERNPPPPNPLTHTRSLPMVLPWAGLII